MRISELCIQRPVFATVMSLTVMLLGLVSYSRLTVREYPKIDEPVVTVEVKYLGASADIIESQVTKPLEDSIAGIEGVDVLTSISRAEQQPDHRALSSLDRDPDSARPPMCATASRGSARRLPQDQSTNRSIAKVEADANPIIWLAFSSESRIRRSKSPTSPIASSSRKPADPCPEQPTCGCSASASTPCASGSTASGWRRTT
jgi:multidrug efflux pump